MAITKQSLENVLKAAPKLGRFTYSMPSGTIFDDAAFADGLAWLATATDADILAAQEEARTMLRDYAWCARNFKNLEISSFAEICEAALA
jgi:hypothetical protein